MHDSTGQKDGGADAVPRENAAPRKAGGGWHPPIDDEAKGLFLAGLKRGLSMEDAARNAGRSVGGFWKARRRDPAFAEAVEEMLELSNTPHFIAPGNGRRWQLRRIRRLRFVQWRREVFLARLAGTCDVTAAAEAAGVSESTVYRHRAKDPDFAAAFQEALEQGYARLEAEALRQRLEAQRLLREGVLPAGEIAQEFERVLKLLQRWDRRNGKVGPRTIAPGRRQRWTFEQAIEELDRYLAALGIPIVGEEGEEGSEGAEGVNNSHPGGGRDP
jgi:hypothetical protein